MTSGFEISLVGVLVVTYDRTTIFRKCIELPRSQNYLALYACLLPQIVISICENVRLETKRKAPGFGCVIPSFLPPEEEHKVLSFVFEKAEM